MSALPYADTSRRWRPAGDRRQRGVRDRRPGRLTYLTLLGVAFFSTFPLYWSVVVASNTTAAIGRTPPALLPGNQLWENVRRVFLEVPFAKALLNSLVVSGTVTVTVVVSSTLAGFAFAKLRFRGNRLLLLAVVGTMMVPTQLNVIPLYLLMDTLGWTNTLYAVIAPAAVSGFGVFFMTAFLTGAVPTELLEAARIDGCNTFGLYRHVVLPAARPAIAVLGLFAFMLAWNDFFWPLVVLSPENPTVQVALSTLASGYVQDYSLVLAGTVLGTLPLIALFAILGRQIIGGIMRGAVKG